MPPCGQYTDPRSCRIFSKIRECSRSCIEGWGAPLLWQGPSAGSFYRTGCPPSQRRLGERVRVSGDSEGGSESAATRRAGACPGPRGARRLPGLVKGQKWSNTSRAGQRSEPVKYFLGRSKVRTGQILPGPVKGQNRSNTSRAGQRTEPVKYLPGWSKDRTGQILAGLVKGQKWSNTSRAGQRTELVKYAQLRAGGGRCADPRG